MQAEAYRLRRERDEARLELLRVLTERNELRRVRDSLIQAMKDRGLATTEQSPAEFQTDDETRYHSKSDDDR
ncbi:MAG: hypothetical protein J2P16_00080 [Mycobacterium sp.]|nr:hypothetical protein [Mycobacterium sp.]